MERVAARGASLATYAYGDGPPVIFLHGGPGDTHHYMKRMAEPLFGRFRCIFFDQRGSGGSVVERREAGQFTLPLLLEDLHLVQKYYEVPSCALVGHSWGAMYGLFACIDSPARFSKAALLNMGPLDRSAEVKTSEHLLAVLNETEKSEWRALREKRNRARDEGDTKSVLAWDAKLMKLRVKSWVFDESLHESFLSDYFQDPPPDRDVNKWIWEAVGGCYSWERVRANTTKMWLCVGREDAVPVEQAERVAAELPDGRVSIFERCGHIPWLEHRERFYAELARFLSA